jgi:hypothetical protein
LDVKIPFLTRQRSAGDCTHRVQKVSREFDVHSRAVPSSPPVARILPYGLNATASMAPPPAVMGVPIC